MIAHFSSRRAPGGGKKEAFPPSLWKWNPGFFILLNCNTIWSLKRMFLWGICETTHERRCSKWKLPGRNSHHHLFNSVWGRAACLQGLNLHSLSLRVRLEPWDCALLWLYYTVAVCLTVITELLKMSKLAFNKPLFVLEVRSSVVLQPRQFDVEIFKIN